MSDNTTLALNIFVYILSVIISFLLFIKDTKAFNKRLPSSTKRITNGDVVTCLLFSSIPLVNIILAIIITFIGSSDWSERDNDYFN